MTSLFERIDQHHTGLSPAKVARKYKLLLENPFRFYRGTNRLFYEDLVTAIFPQSPPCWICGDLHIENFGSYKGDDRLVYFDLNDFDESILAPVGWEVIRLLTSIVIAFDALKITEEETAKTCEYFITKYAAVLAEGNPRSIETRTANGVVKKFLKAVETRSQDELLTNRTVLKHGVLKLDDRKSKQLHINKELKKLLITAMQEWVLENDRLKDHFKVMDVRFRVAGTGSLGIKRYMFLLESAGETTRHILLDMKQATPSSLVDLVPVSQPEWTSEAERMVTIQKVMQHVPPAELGAMMFEGESFLIQELQPTKDRINFKIIENDFANVCEVIEQFALLAASAHLRTVGRMGSCTADELMAFGKEESWRAPMIAYAMSYKNKVIADYNEFSEYLKGRKRKKSIKRKIQKDNIREAVMEKHSLNEE